MPNAKALSKFLDAAVEAARLEALNELQILDTLPEQSFDDLVWLASKICEVPISLISLVDSRRQWFKARCGLDAPETPRDMAFCAHALGSDDVMQVEDALQDERFAHNPLVTGEPFIRFYAGAPLLGRNGHRFGTLCVIDTSPRQLTADQLEALKRLARRASDKLETRRQQIVAQARERTMSQLLESLPDAVITCDGAGTLKEFNHAARDWHGVDVREIQHEEWAHHFDLYEPDGSKHLVTDEVPLVRAWKGESVRDARIVIKANGQAARHVSCNADPLFGPQGKLIGAVCVMHDVTQLMLARDKARVESQRFAGAFAAASQGMALVSVEGRWLEANEALCEMLGYSNAELMELDFQRVTHPEDLDIDLQLVADVLAGRRTSYHLDKRYFHRSGRTVQAHLSVSLVRDGDGTPIHFVAQIQDLTQRYQAEQRLRESEQRLRSVLEHSYDAFISLDERETIVEWNRAAETTFGWRRSEVLGKVMSEVIVPLRLRPAHQTGMRRYLQTGETRVLDQRLQVTALHRNGGEFPIEMTISVVQHGARRLFNAFMHDITDRLAAEDRLRSSEERMRLVANSVPALIAQVGRDLKYRFVNRAYADWFDTTAESLIGRHMSEVLKPEHYEKVKPKLEQVLQGTATSFDMDVVDSQGALRHMHASYIPEAPQAQAAHGGFHLTVHDVTAQVRLAKVMEHRAMTDELTALPNRAAWAVELSTKIQMAQQAGSTVAVMFIDLNGFKQINDTYGHAAGDLVLREFADRLRIALRAEDFIARLGGDEFVVLLDGIKNTEHELARIALKLQNAMKAAVQIDGGLMLDVRPSIGFAVQDGPHYDAMQLMHHADEAMYEAKRRKDLGYVAKTPTCSEA